MAPMHADPARFVHPRLPAAFLATGLLALSLLAGCASTGRDDALREAQYAWSAAIRWGDFDGAWQLVDPEWREAHPLTELERARYEQVQISFYRDGAQRADGDTVQRAVDIGVINRHTLEERQLRYTEQWRWDPEAEAWWIADGLPDLWAAHP